MKKIYLSLFIFVSLSFSQAQVANYVFSQFIGTFTLITVPGSTVVAQGSQDDNVYSAIPIGFSFMYNNSTYTSVGVSTNGWMTFGSYFPNDNFAPISNSGGNGDAVGVLSGDMQLGAYHTATITNGSNVIALAYPQATTVLGIGDAVSGTGIPGGATITNITPTSMTISANATANGTTFTSPGIISYVCTGSAPNRVFTMQWRRQSRYSNNGTGIDDYINVQVKLYETTNVVDIIYGACGTNNANTMTSETGLVGQTNLDFNNRDVPASVNWQSSNPGTMNNATCFFGNNTTVPLNLTYRWTPPAACTGTPPSNTAVASSSLACLNGNINLNVANIYTLTGLSFEWGSAPAVTGPFTPLNTSTISAFTATNISANTWFICTVTCTNSSQSFTTAPIAITAVGSITNSTPYFEGFESVQLNNSLPNCSWAASNPSLICQTYTSMTTNNRIPNSGTKFAAFHFGTDPAGDYFYTNGIYLYSGITYSANVFYVTDGADGWSEFSMYYGSSQSTVGLVNIATVTGTLNNQLHLALTNTFTIPSNGFYHIAIKGIGNTTPWFLSWDDLSITAPCNLNTPTLSISGGTSVQCAGTPVSLMAAGANSYTWSTGPTSQNATVTPLANTDYTVYGAGPTGCLTQAVKSISVEALPSVSITPITQTICLMDVASIEVSGAVSYTWNPSNSHASTFTLSPAASNIYSVSYTGTNSCINTSTAEVIVDACTGINELDLSHTRVYPNPTQDHLKIQIDQIGLKIIELSEVTGKVIRTAQFDSPSYQLSTADLPRGIYYLKIVSGNSTEIRKVIRD